MSVVKEKECYTVAELRNKVGMSRATIYNKIENGVIPGVFRIGNTYKFKKDKIDEWIENGGELKDRKRW